VLDLDDTLFLERDYVKSGFAAVGDWAKERFQLVDFAAHAYNYFDQGRRGDIFDAVLKDCCSGPIDTSDIQAMVDIYRRHSPNISLLPDAIDFLAFCQGRFDLALITDGPPESQRRKVDALGLGPLFAVMVFTGEWQDCSKPNPRAFHFVEQRLAAPGTEFCYIADNPAKDFQAPLTLGWTAIRIRRQQGLYSIGEAPLESAPHLEIATLDSLKPLLDWSFAVSK
jgi:putative hydrolase of the HAD superfamily